MAFRDEYNLEPLKVTAYLRTGVVADRWLPLDSILMYQANRDALGPELATVPGGSDVQAASTLPLDIAHPGRRNWYYKCSWAQPQPWWVAEGKDHWNKRFDSSLAGLVDFGARRGKVLIEQGQYKAYHMPVFYLAAQSVEWYCVGDSDEIRYLLSTVTHVGKKRSQGWGRVTEWRVEACSEDWSVQRDGKLTRGIPADDMLGGQPFNILYYGIRPRYYRQNNQMPLVMPG